MARCLQSQGLIHHFEGDGTAPLQSWTSAAALTFSPGGGVTNVDDAYYLNGGYILVNGATVTSNAATFNIRASNFSPEVNSILASFSTSTGTNVRVVWDTDMKSFTLA